MSASPLSIRTIQQKMDNSSVWDGAAPAGSPVIANDMEAFAEGIVGGLFDFGNVNPIILRQVMVKFGSGTTSWTLSLVDVDDTEIILASESDANPLFSTDVVGVLAGLIILQGQKLKLESSAGPTTASVARIGISAA